MLPFTQNSTLQSAVVYIAVILVGTGGELFASECPCIVILRGDEDAVAAVSERLHKLNIETSPRADCPALVATVLAGDRTYILRMSTRTEPNYVREVARTETVAVLIDAQVRNTVADLSIEIENGDGNATRSDDVSEPPKASPADRAAASQTPTADRAAASQTSTVDRTPFETERGILTQAVFESTYAFDRTVWLGGQASACAMLGPLCIGVAFRFAHDDALTGISDKYGAKRFTLDGSILVHLSMAWGRVALSPGVCIGGGVYWVYARMGGDHDEKYLGEHRGFRASFFVSIMIRVTRQIYVEALELSSSHSLPGHRDTYAGDAANPGFTIYEPKGFLRAGIGIRYRLPLGG
jgi:hypothetical protein